MLLRNYFTVKLTCIDKGEIAIRLILTSIDINLISSIRKSSFGRV